MCPGIRSATIGLLAALAVSPCDARAQDAPITVYGTGLRSAAPLQSSAAPAARLRVSRLPLDLQPWAASRETAEPSPPVVPVRAPVWVSRRRWGLAIPGMLGGNALPMIYNEFVQPWKEISRTSPYSWELYWNMGEWDDNHFFNNQLFHPIQGHFYYNAARSNGFGYLWGLGFAAIGSYLWECCGERRPGSWNDFLNTSLGGAALGEILFRASSLIIDNTETGIDRIGREAALFPLNTELFMARGVYGEWRDTVNPPDRFPDEWSLALGSGLRRASEGSLHPFVDLQLRYGSLFGETLRDPFDLFSVDAQVNGANQPIGLVKVRGLLYQRRLAGTQLVTTTSPGFVLKFVLTQNYDYLDSSRDPGEIPLGAPEEEFKDGYRFGAQSLGLGLATAFSLGSARLNLLGEFDGIPIGAVNALPSSYVGILGEREREYDFGVGWGLEGRGGILVPGLLMGTASYQYARLYTLNGSNVRLPSGDRIESHHQVHAATAGVHLELDEVLEFITQYPCLWARHFWIGADWLWFKKKSTYSLPGSYLPEDHDTHQLRFMVKWDYTRYLGGRAYGQP